VRSLPSMGCQYAALMVVSNGIIGGLPGICEGRRGLMLQATPPLCAGPDACWMTSSAQRPRPTRSVRAVRSMRLLPVHLYALRSFVRTDD